MSALGQQCLLLLLVLLLVLLNPACTFINGPLLSSPQLHRLCHLYPARKLAVQRLAILEHRSDLQEEGHYFITIILSLTEIQIWDPFLSFLGISFSHTSQGLSSPWALLQGQSFGESLAIFCHWPVLVTPQSPTHHPRLPGPFRFNIVDASKSDLGQRVLATPRFTMWLPHILPFLGVAPEWSTYDPFSFLLAAFFWLWKELLSLLLPGGQPV